MYEMMLERYTRRREYVPVTTLILHQQSISIFSRYSILRSSYAYNFTVHEYVQTEKINRKTFLFSTFYLDLLACELFVL